MDGERGKEGKGGGGRGEIEGALWGAEGERKGRGRDLFKRGQNHKHGSIFSKKGTLLTNACNKREEWYEIGNFLRNIITQIISRTNRNSKEIDKH